MNDSKTSPENQTLLNERQTAAMLGVSGRTLQGWRFKGQGPQFVSMSKRAVRYRLCDLTAWVESNLRNSTTN